MMKRIFKFIPQLSALSRRRLKKEIALPSPFFRTLDIDAVHAYFVARKSELGNISELVSTLAGYCYVCQANVDFQIESAIDGETVNWRETLVCPECHLINRWRGCLHLFEEYCEPSLQDRIYLTETLSPVYKSLASRYPNLSASEFLPPAELGSLVPIHSMLVRNEDVTQLTFSDNYFESILCFDVLEHVPDYKAALKEFYRVLTEGGRLVVSVPFSFKKETLVRAERDDSGHIRHLVEPCYHGDPLSDGGVLSYYDFGMELLEEMNQAGFQETCLMCYCSKPWGYLHENIAFVGRKVSS